jgi:hypothetical protein
MKCLDKDPAKRYADAQLLAADLARFRIGEAIQAQPLGRLELVRRWIRRKPKMAGLVAALVLAVLVAFGAIAALWLEARSEVKDLKLEIQKQSSPHETR